MRFNLASFDALDKIALIASQEANLGNVGLWFNEFRGGLHGFYSRAFGIRRHYSEVHAWIPRPRLTNETEYHLTSIFFHMDSALECITFALNALGWATRPSDFRDITNPAQLRRISPADVTGDVRSGSQPGYSRVFPELQRRWNESAGLINRIRELHDVSKHRKMIYEGGKARLDSPPGFYEALGIPAEDVGARALLWPSAELILVPNPRNPVTMTCAMEPQFEVLEDMAPAFAELVRATGEAALTGAKAIIRV